MSYMVQDAGEIFTAGIPCSLPVSEPLALKGIIALGLLWSCCEKCSFTDCHMICKWMRESWDSHSIHSPMVLQAVKARRESFSMGREGRRCLSGTCSQQRHRGTKPSTPLQCRRFSSTKRKEQPCTDFYWIQLLAWYKIYLIIFG